MCDSRRSGRTRKAVDYTKFSTEEDFADDDDDFSGLTPPPGKKLKIAKESKPKERLKKKEKLKKEKYDSKDKDDSRPAEEVLGKPVPSRLSRDEKNYERELQLALEISKQELSQPSPSKKDAANNGSNTSEASDVETPASPNKNPENTTCATSKEKSNLEKQKADLDAIEVLEEDVQDNFQGRSRRKAAVRKKKYSDAFEDSDSDEDEDEDFKIEKDSISNTEEDNEEDDDDEDFDADEDLDFTAAWSKKKKSSKGRGKGKGQKPPAATTISPSKPKARLSSTVTPVNKGGKTSSKIGNSTSVTFPKAESYSVSQPKASSGGSLVIRKPNWCPPGPAGSKSPLSGVGVKSPGSLRLGLSKKARTKPLHPAAKSTS